MDRRAAIDRAVDEEVVRMNVFGAVLGPVIAGAIAHFDRPQPSRRRKRARPRRRSR